MRAALAFLIATAAIVPFFLVIAQEPGVEEEASADGRCMKCHADPVVGNQWGVWESGPHASAFDVLGTEEAKKVAARIGFDGDPKAAADCLACHAPDAGAPEMGVSCEACHGAGHDYAGVCGESFPDAVKKGMRLSGERDCLECHRKTAAHPDMDFLFVLDMKKVAHPRPVKDADEALFSTEGLYRKWEVITVEDGLPHHMVFGVTPHGDDVWFATEDGVALLRDGKIRSWHEEDGLPHQAVTQIAVDEATGEVWASTLAGIASFDGEKWTAYTQQNSGLVNNCTFGIALFEEDVWVATFDGISRYNRKSKEWKKYYLDNAPLEEVWIYGVEADFEKVNFAVWGGGLVEYYPDRDYWNAHHDPDGSFELNLLMGDGVISQMTTSVSHDNGWTWIASYFGMCGYNGRDWIEMDMDDSGLSSNFINFAKARRSQGWFATDRGLSCFDLARDRWVNYRRLDGPGDYGEITITSRDGKKRRSVVTETFFPFNFVWGIAFSGEDIWVATSNGVARGGTEMRTLFLVIIAVAIGAAFALVGQSSAPLRGGAGADETPAAPVEKEPAGNPNPDDDTAPGHIPWDRPDIGFAGKVLPPRYVQPFYNFARPSSIPLDRAYSEFVDPIGRMDRSFENDTEVRIGFIGCLSGPAKSYSGEMLNGAMMAVEEINAAGGYHGKPVVLKTRDDKASMGEDANQMVKLCFEDRVLGVLGSMSSDTTHVALRVALKAEVPEITCISTDPTITQIVVPWIFRCLADDWSQSRALAKYVFEERKFKRVALLEHNNRYGRMGSAELKRVAKRMGVPIKVAIKYPSKASLEDFKSYLKIIKDYGADAIVNWGLYPQAAKIVKLMDEMDYDIPYFGADGLVAQAFIDNAGESAEGVVVTYPYDFYRDDPLTRSFNARFEEKYGHPPDSFAAHGYDTMYVMWQAVQKGGMNRTRIRDALAETKDFHGVTGMISFDHRGNDMRGVDFAVVHDGKFLPLRMAGEHVRKGAHEE